LWLTLDEGRSHEEEAATRIARAVMGNGFKYSLPSEGRVNLKLRQRPAENQPGGTR